MVRARHQVRPGWQAERVPVALHHQHRYDDSLQLRDPRPLRPTRRVEGEGKAEDRVGTHLLRRTAGDPGPGAPATHDQRPTPATEGARQRGKDVHPGKVEPGWRLGDLPTADPPGLLDEHDPPAQGQGGGTGGEQVDRVDASPGAVPQHEQAVALAVALAGGAGGVDAGNPDGRLDVYRLYEPGESHPAEGKRSRMRTLDPDSVSTRAPVPPPDSPYWQFYEAVAAAQLAAWMPAGSARVLDLSGDDPRRAQQLRDAGHAVVRVGASRVERVQSVTADARSLGWLRDSCVDAIVAESGALSKSLATEETVRDLVRLLRPGGRLLLVVDSLLTGLSRLAQQGRWAELADVPSADVVLVPSEDGLITRCFWPEELTGLLRDAGLDVEWVRPRSVLTPAAVEHALASGGDEALRTLVRSELRLAVDREGEAVGIHLVASARKPD